MLLPRWVWCRIPRLLVSASRVNPTGALFALTGTRGIWTGTASLGYLFSGIDRIISLQLLVFTRVYTLVTAPADMRRRGLSLGHSTGTTIRVNVPGSTSIQVCLKESLILTIGNSYQLIYPVLLPTTSFTR